MKTSKLTAFVCASLSCSASLSHAATTIDVSFSAYDSGAGNTPYYSEYSITSDVGVPVLDGTHKVVDINLYDSGWGFNPLYRSSYHVEALIGGVENEHAALRSIGWHDFDVSFNLITSTATVSMDGNAIHSGTYTGSLNWFNFFYNGHTQSTVIDNFAVKSDGSTVYSQNFNSVTLDPAWVITRQDAGATINSGSGVLALGANVAGIAFDLNSVIPEPSSLLLGGVSALGLLRRKR
jgi:hypothetical protein